jgi:hypothetical protein
MLYEILVIFIATLTMSLNMAKRKNYIKLADRAKLFMEKHKRNFKSRGAGHDLPPFIRELCTFGGLPYEDWEALRSDERYSQKHYSLPEPVYGYEESCESCGLIYVDEIFCVACPLPKGQLTNPDSELPIMVAAAWKRASAVLGIPEIAQRYDLPEYDLDVKRSMLWLARMLRFNAGEASNRDQLWIAINELPIHRAANFTSTESLCRGGVSVYTIELPHHGKYYVQFVGTRPDERLDSLPMSSMSSDAAELKAVEAAQQHDAYVHHNEGVVAAKNETPVLSNKTPVLSKKAQMRKRLKQIQPHRGR